MPAAKKGPSGRPPPKEVTDWLLEGEPWVEYRTRRDLLGESEAEAGVIHARAEMINHPNVQSLLEELRSWPGTVLSSRRSASQPFHRLSFIADLGLRRDDPYINEIAGKVLEHESDEGPFQLPVNTPKQHTDSAKNEWAWALCDAPIILYSLIKLGFGEDKRIQKAVSYLVGLARENGWPCAVSKELGSFRGPGKKEEPCPYATLAMLKLLSQLPQRKNSREARTGVESLLNLWTKSRELHPYMFYMGTDFRKLKAPFVWYDILHTLEVLSNFKSLRNDVRMVEMADVIKSKADSEGKYTPESEWKAWKGWDFGQKERPSRWLTFLILSLFKRLEY